MFHIFPKPRTMLLASLIVLLAAFALAACGETTPSPQLSPAPSTPPTEMATSVVRTGGETLAAATAAPVKATTVPPTATPATRTTTINYNYDGAGRLTQAEYSNGVVIKYTYDKAGNLLSREVAKK